MKKTSVGVGVVGLIVLAFGVCAAACGDSTESTVAQDAGPDSPTIVVTQDGAPGTDGAASCMTDTDCSSGFLCGYATADACMAKGTCVPSTPSNCGAIASSCACDGTEVATGCIDYPAGYVSKPIASMSACAGDGGGSCMTTTDCTSGFVCGFATAEACAAKGKCVPLTPSHCGAIQASCACDGTSVDTGCIDYPAGYVGKPLQSDLPCAADAGASDASGDH